MLSPTTQYFSPAAHKISKLSAHNKAHTLLGAQLEESAHSMKDKDQSAAAKELTERHASLVRLFTRAEKSGAILVSPQTTVTVHERATDAERAWVQDHVTFMSRTEARLLRSHVRKCGEMQAGLSYEGWAASWQGGEKADKFLAAPDGAARTYANNSQFDPVGTPYAAEVDVMVGAAKAAYALPSDSYPLMRCLGAGTTGWHQDSRSGNQHEPSTTVVVVHACNVESGTLEPKSTACLHAGLGIHPGHASSGALAQRGGTHALAVLHTPHEGTYIMPRSYNRDHAHRVEIAAAETPPTERRYSTIVWIYGGAKRSSQRRDHACAQCDAAFGRTCELSMHVRAVHEKRKDHACPQCAAAFGKASNLRRHVRTVHEQRKDHACPQCDAAFQQAGGLRMHVRTVHEKRKDHACPQCDAAFGQAGNLRTHVRVVHEQRKDHACPQCDYKTGQAGDLRKHVRTVHEQQKNHACPQ
jgi:uncharacterized C2H2 Zn-finger protein